VFNKFPNLKSQSKVSFADKAPAPSGTGHVKKILGQNFEKLRKLLKTTPLH
jgi:hypothetical protein